MSSRDFKRGDLVKVVYLKDSSFNAFKGYFAEVKNYFKDSQTITVILEAENICKPRIINVDHIVKR